VPGDVVPGEGPVTTNGGHETVGNAGDRLVIVSPEAVAEGRASLPLADTREQMEGAVEGSADRDLDDMTPFAPLVDVRSPEHERAERLLFLS